MTKKAQYLFLTLLIALLLAACGGEPEVGPTVVSTETAANTDCNFEIPISGEPNPDPGDRVYLTAEIEVAQGNLFGWTLSWEADPPILLETDLPTVSLIAPNDVLQIAVGLTATNDEGCVGSGTFLVTVQNDRIAGVDIATADEQEPAPTATASPEPSPTNTAVPAPTNTPSPTPQPTPTATATSAPLLIVSAEPTAVSLPKPVITYLEFLPGGAVIVHWTWDGQLTSTQNFAVRFWSQNDPRPEARFSITWTKDFQHEFGVNNVDFPIGTYLINVAVMEGPSDGVHTEVVRSDDQPLFVNPPPPTEPPPPLP